MVSLIHHRLASTTISWLSSGMTFCSRIKGYPASCSRILVKRLLEELSQSKDATTSSDSLGCGVSSPDMPMKQEDILVQGCIRGGIFLKHLESVIWCLGSARDTSGRALDLQRSAISHINPEDIEDKSGRARGLHSAARGGKAGIYPVRALRVYTALRLTGDGPLFIAPHRIPV